MVTVEGFWDDAPLNVIEENKLAVEPTWDEFVESMELDHQYQEY
jgi:hypothetical protein